MEKSVLITYAARGDSNKQGCSLSLTTPLFSYIPLASIIASTVTYFHCTRCNSGIAFLKLIGVAVIAYAVVKFLWNKAVDDQVDKSSMTGEKKQAIKIILKAQL